MRQSEHNQDVLWWRKSTNARPFLPLFGWISCFLSLLSSIFRTSIREYFDWRTMSKRSTAIVVFDASKCAILHERICQSWVYSPSLSVLGVHECCKLSQVSKRANKLNCRTKNLEQTEKNYGKNNYHDYLGLLVCHRFTTEITLWSIVLPFVPFKYSSTRFEHCSGELWNHLERYLHQAISSWVARVWLRKSSPLSHIHRNV